MELGLKENPNVRRHSITIPGAGDSGVSQVTPGIIYPLLVSKKKHQKSQIIHLDGSDISLQSCPDSGKHLFGSDLLGSTGGERKKKKSPNSTIDYSQLPFRPFRGKPLDGKWSCGNSPCAGTLQVMKEGRKTAPSTLWRQRGSSTPSTPGCCSISPALALTLPVISPAPALPSPTAREIGSQPISFPSLRARWSCSGRLF